MNRKINLKKGCAIFLAVLAVGILLFLTIAHDQLLYTAKEDTYAGESNSGIIGEFLDGMVISQEFTVNHRYITGAKILLSTFARENNSGTIAAELVNPATGEILALAVIDVAEVKDNQWNAVDFDRYIDKEELTDGKAVLRVSNSGSQEGSAVTLNYEIRKEGAAEYGETVINGEPAKGQDMCFSLTGVNLSKVYPYYTPFFIIFFGLAVFYCVFLIRTDKKGKMTLGLHFLYTCKRYSFLLQQLISRDFKTKYKRSVLGVFWSFLNPLLTMAVQYAVFSRIFRFEIPNYQVYLLTGIVFFNSFSDSTSQAMNAIVGNAPLITKVYVPKYIYPVSKVLSTSINLLFSLIPLLLVVFVSGLPVTPAMVFLPFGIACVVLFTIGLSFALSAAMVFFRDMQFLWGVFTMIWMYATPIIYPMSTIEGSILEPLQKINPMYHYITFCRTILIDGVSPEPSAYLACIGFTLLALAAGGLIFKKTQDQFVLHI